LDWDILRNLTVKLWSVVKVDLSDAFFACDPQTVLNVSEPSHLFFVPAPQHEGFDRFRSGQQVQDGIAAAAIVKNKMSQVDKLGKKTGQFRQSVYGKVQVVQVFDVFYPRRDVTQTI
jgi:hypothetical protein